MTLTIQDLGALGEFFGSIAVLATLIYLALQTRQNTMAIGAQLDAAALGSIQNSILTAATSNELGELMAEDSTADVTANQLRLTTYWTSVLLAFQWQFRQARRGLLPSFDEAGVAATMRFFFSGYRSVEFSWERMKPSLSPDFVEWVEEQRSKAA